MADTQDTAVAPVETEELVVKSVTLPEGLEARLREKMVSEHEDEIIELMKQRRSYIESIKMIDEQIEKRTKIYI